MLGCVLLVLAAQLRQSSTIQTTDGTAFKVDVLVVDGQFKNKKMPMGVLEGETAQGAVDRFCDTFEGNFPAMATFSKAARTALVAEVKRRQELSGKPAIGRGELLFSVKLLADRERQQIDFHADDNIAQVASSFLERDSDLATISEADAHANRNTVVAALHARLQSRIWDECETDHATATQEAWDAGGDMLMRSNTSLFNHGIGLGSNSSYSLEPHPFPYPFPSVACHNIASLACRRHAGIFNGYEVTSHVSHASRLQQLLRIKREHPAVRHCVETGTFFGQTTQALSKHCDTVVTMEVQPELAANAVKLFKDEGFTNIHLMQGDSGELMHSASFQQIVPPSEPALFYLDGHFSSGVTGRGASDCPIIAELNAILGRGNHNDVVLIDDAREFNDGRIKDNGGDPWPDVRVLQEMLCARYPDWIFDLQNDMFIAHKNSDIRKLLYR